MVKAAAKQHPSRQWKHWKRQSQDMFDSCDCFTWAKELVQQAGHLRHDYDGLATVGNVAAMVAMVANHAGIGPYAWLFFWHSLALFGAKWTNTGRLARCSQVLRVREFPEKITLQSWTLIPMYISPPCRFCVAEWYISSFAFLGDQEDGPTVQLGHDVGIPLLYAFVWAKHHGIWKLLHNLRGS